VGGKFFFSMVSCEALVKGFENSAASGVLSRMLLGLVLGLGGNRSNDSWEGRVVRFVASIRVAFSGGIGRGFGWKLFFRTMSLVISSLNISRQLDPPLRKRNWFIDLSSLFMFSTSSVSVCCKLHSN